MANGSRICLDNQTGRLLSLAVNGSADALASLRIQPWIVRTILASDARVASQSSLALEKRINGKPYLLADAKERSAKRQEARQHGAPGFNDYSKTVLAVRAMLADERFRVFPCPEKDSLAALLCSVREFMLAAKSQSLAFLENWRASGERLPIF